MNPPELADRVEATHGHVPEGYDHWDVLCWCPRHKGACWDEADPRGCPACASERSS